MAISSENTLSLIEARSPALGDFADRLVQTWRADHDRSRVAEGVGIPEAARGTVYRVVALTLLSEETEGPPPSADAVLAAFRRLVLVDGERWRQALNASWNGKEAKDRRRPKGTATRKKKSAPTLFAVEDLASTAERNVLRSRLGRLPMPSAHPDDGDRYRRVSPRTRAHLVAAQLSSYTRSSVAWAGALASVEDEDAAFLYGAAGRIVDAFRKKHPGLREDEFEAIFDGLLGCGIDGWLVARAWLAHERRWGRGMRAGAELAASASRLNKTLDWDAMPELPWFCLVQNGRWSIIRRTIVRPLGIELPEAKMTEYIEAGIGAELFESGVSLQRYGFAVALASRGADAPW